MIKRILVGLGGTPFTPTAIRQSIELAQRHGARLTGVTIVDQRRLLHLGPTPIGAGGVAEELREHRIQVTKQHVENAISTFETACVEAKVPHVVDRETGDEFTLMASLARYHDLMVFGLRSVFDGALEISPADALARLLGRGVRPILAVSEEPKTVQRVLMAYSGSAESAKTIKRFVHSHLWADLSLRILTCDSNEDAARERLESMAEYCRAHGLAVETQHSTSSPKQEIIATAGAWKADLIVLGNSMHSFLRQKLFGETALHVMQHSTHPLFLSY